MKSDEQAVRELHATWIDAVNAGDLVRLLTLISDDVVFLNPGKAPFGRDGFPAGFLDAHKRLYLTCISDLRDVVVAGDVAYTLSADSLSVKTRDTGETTQLAGDRLTVYRKHPDGRWLLARDCHTLSIVKT